MFPYCIKFRFGSRADLREDIILPTANMKFNQYITSTRNRQIYS